MIAIGSGTLAAVVGGGVVLGVLSRKRLRAFIQREGRGHAWLVVLLIVLTGVFYSVPHEYGHKVVAEGLGGEIRSVTWTIFGGEPRVVYARLPAGAGPWATAGGLFLPILLAFLLVAARVIFGPRLPRWAQALLSVPAAVIFCASCGCVIPVFSGGGHMAPLASRYGLGEAGRVLLQLVPVVVSAAGLCCLWLGTRPPAAADA